MINSDALYGPMFLECWFNVLCNQKVTSYVRDGSVLGSGLRIGFRVWDFL